MPPFPHLRDPSQSRMWRKARQHQIRLSETTVPQTPRTRWRPRTCISCFWWQFWREENVETCRLSLSAEVLIAVINTVPWGSQVSTQPSSSQFDTLPAGNTGHRRCQIKTGFLEKEIVDLKVRPGHSLANNGMDFCPMDLLDIKHLGTKKDNLAKKFSIVDWWQMLRWPVEAKQEKWEIGSRKCNLVTISPWLQYHLARKLELFWKTAFND